MSDLGLALVVGALGFGLRHGVDWDHIAAISDLTSTQTRRRRSLTIATTYALGHAVVVLVLGALAIAFAANLPGWVDGMMERIVGVTLVALGLYVLIGLARHGRSFGLRSRWMLVFDLVRRVRRTRSEEQDALVDADGRSVAPTSSRHRRHVPPGEGSAEYGIAAAIGIGVIHGVGAETPTQVVVFAAAAGAGGTAAGLTVLAFFVVGLLVSNTVLAVVATHGLLGASRSFPLYAALCLVTASVSLLVGLAALSGRSEGLPAL